LSRPSHDPSGYPGFIADVDGDPVGVITYRLGEGDCEVVTFNAFRERQRIGTAWLLAVRHVAARADARLWLMTTNDNLWAIRFYQRGGMDMVALDRNFDEVVRAQKAWH
jgi:GNAT superfamily N-acetyltransferase